MKEPGFYIIEYSHNNITWSINVWADSYKDAKKKLKSIHKTYYNLYHIPLENL